MAIDRHSMRPGRDVRSILVGRDRERAHLSDLLAAALDGHGSLVLLSGEAGIGKTTLVQDLMQQAAAQSALVLSGGCYDLTITPPYGPWREALRHYHPGKGHVFLPAWFSNPSELGRIGSQAALFEEIRQFFEAIAREQPLLILLEDLHWSDQASLELLRFLARRLTEVAVLIVVTYRDDEITRRHDLYRLLPVLVRESSAHRVHLNPLSDEAVRELVHGRYELADADAGLLVAHLMQRSEGNPFFAGEILYGLEDEQLLRQADSGWVLTDLGHARVPALLHQLIQDRIRQLTPATRSALQVAAVIGQAIALDLWRNVASLQEPELDQIIAESLDASLLEEMRDRAGLQFRHALLRETLYESLILSRRRALHSRVGRELAQTWNPDPDAVAHHLQQAGDSQAVPWLIRAGWRAECSYAMGMAVRHYETAETILEHDPTSVRARGWLRFHCAVVSRFTDREAGLAYLEEAGRIAARIQDPVLAAHALALHGMLRAWGGELRAALAEMEEATGILDRASSQDYAAARQAITSLYPDAILADHAAAMGHPLFRVTALPSVNIIVQFPLYWLGVVGQFQRAVELGEPYLAQVAAATDDEVKVRGLCRFTYTALASAYDVFGEPETAQRWRRLELEAALLFNDQANAGSARVSELRQLLTYYPERVAERRAVCQAAVAAGEALRVGLGAGDGFRPIEVPLDLLEGRWSKARRLLAMRWPFGPVQLLRTIWLGIFGREQGEPQLAWEQIREILPQGPDTEPGDCDYFSAVTQQQLAINLSLDAGDREAARAWLDAHDRWLDWSGAVVGRAERALLWARYYRAAGDQQRARQTAEQALTYASAPRQPLALIAARRFLGQLAVGASDEVAAAKHLQASLELATRCEAPFERAQTLLVMAERATVGGNVDDARRLLREVRIICESLEARRVLAQVAVLEHRLHALAHAYPAGLSAREVEVLALVVAGLSNPEIGARLFISPRTVSQHLRSVFNKLDVNSRTAAVARWLELTRS